MNRLGMALLMVVASAAPVLAASAVNKESSPQTLVVTEGSSKSELVIGPGETIDFCPHGCFVTLPNGDREALSGSETVEFSGGKTSIK